VSRSWVAPAALAAIAAAALPASAAAATGVGQTFTPASDCADMTVVQSSAPSNAYTVPGPGVITRWSFESGSNAPAEVRLKLARPAGEGMFTITRQSARRNGPSPGAMETFNTREPVAGGELLGVYLTDGECTREAVDYDAHNAAGDQPPGSTTAYNNPMASAQLDVSAILEPDADNDGFGDETQDCDPADPNRAEDCAPPETVITLAPKNKTRNKTATFHFSGSDTGTVARFECSLDGGPFAPCNSPHVIRVKKGRHNFSVRAVDESGNVDASPASDRWKVKKKRRKRK
jgi:hypothetical protein